MKVIAVSGNSLALPFASVTLTPSGHYRVRVHHVFFGGTTEDEVQMTRATLHTLAHAILTALASEEGVSR